MTPMEYQLTIMEYLLNQELLARKNNNSMRHKAYKLAIVDCAKNISSMNVEQSIDSK